VPGFQGKGIGSNLMNDSIKAATELVFSRMILFGNPEYYHRFGFKNAKEYRITTKDDQNFEPFMVLELKNNGLKNVKSRFFEDDAFETNPEELLEFEKKFPYKEKLVTETQLKFP
jgi:predicted N-acetyltransferase YhbS